MVSQQKPKIEDIKRGIEQQKVVANTRLSDVAKCIDGVFQLQEMLVKAYEDKELPKKENKHKKK